MKAFQVGLRDWFAAVKKYMAALGYAPVGQSHKLEIHRA